MIKSSYSEQLKHPNWQRKRLEVLQEAGFACSNCGETEKMLHVHHKRYIKGRKVWEYALSDLAALCEDCHGCAHDSKELLDELVSAIGPAGVDTLLGLGAGYFLASMDLERELAEKIARGRELEFEVGIVATILDWGGDFRWRRIFVEHASRSPLNPVMEHYADIWRAELARDDAITSNTEGKASEGK